MACNCGKTAAQLEFVFTAPSGAVTVYKTEIEAKAARIRQGGGTIQQRSK